MIEKLVGSRFERNIAYTIGVKHSISSGYHMENVGGPLVYREQPNSEAVCLIGVATASVLNNQQTEIISIFTNIILYEGFIEQAVSLLRGTSRCEIMK